VTKLNRILNNIFPFLIIGALSGYISVCKVSLESLIWLQDLQSFMKIDIDWEAISIDMFSEHAAPQSLTVIIVSLTFFSILHKLVYGEVQELNTWFGMKVVLSLENFGSLLAIAMLGLILGVAMSALTTGDVYSFIKFILVSTFPILTLVLIRFTLRLCQNVELKFHWKEDEIKHKKKSRLQGFFVLGLMMAIMVGHYYIFNWLDSLIGFLLNLFN
jgi:hypothetical protein